MASLTHHDGLERASLESRNIDPRRVHDFLREAKDLRIDFNTFMLYQNGAIVTEACWSPYRLDLRHTMHSATKSFLSAVVGLAIAEGYFTLEDKAISFFPEHVPSSPDPKLAAMTVEDLLTQTSGHATGASGGTWRGIKSSWIAEFFKIPVVYQPGTYFKYSSATSFLLSAIVQKTTGQSAHEFAMPRLFQPLGITDLTWDIGPEGINPGGNGISCRSSDLLKLAVLHLQGGVWRRKQILPREWVERATTSQRGNPYGYHWRIGEGDSYNASGLFGQFAFVFPKYDAIMITTSSTLPEQASLRSLVWRHAPLIFGSRENAGALGDGAFNDYLQKREVPLPIDIKSSSNVRSDVSDRLFVAKSNIDHIDAFTLDFGPESCTFHLWDHRGLHRVDMGLGRWVEGKTTMSCAPLHHGYEPPISRVVARASWSSADCLHMIWQFVETPFQDYTVVRFLDNDEVVLERGTNVNSFSTQRPPIAALMLGKGSGLSLGLSITARSLKASDKANALADPPRTTKYSCSSASMRELVEHPLAKQILEKYCPDLLADSIIQRAGSYSLANIAGNIAPGLDFDPIDVELGKIPLGDNVI